MKFEELFEKLDKLIIDKSTDYTEMRRLLQGIWDTKEVFRWLDDAQDRLYASIASGHLKVLHNLELGNIEQAKEEAAAAIAWFHLRFQGSHSDMASRCPQIAETLQRIDEEAVRNETLRRVLQRPPDKIVSEFSPGGERE